MVYLGSVYRTLECSKTREHSIFALHAFILLPTLHRHPLPRRSTVGSRRSSTAETLPHPWQPPSPPSPAAVLAMGTSTPTLPGLFSTTAPTMHEARLETIDRYMICCPQLRIGSSYCHACISMHARASNACAFNLFGRRTTTTMHACKYITD